MAQTKGNSKKKWNKKTKSNRDEKYDAKELPSEKGKGEGNKGWNDLRWYAKYPELLLSVTNLPVSRATGINVNEMPSSVTKVSGTPTISLGSAIGYGIPGILALNYTPVIGDVSTSTDAINVAARKLFATVTSGNSRSVSYNAAEMAKYILVITGLFAFHEHLKRIYRIVRTYSGENAYYGEALCTAIGVDFGDLKAHINDLLGFTNLFGAQINQWFLPKDISYVERMIWMNSGVYTDSPNIRGQIYVFRPDGFLKYDNSVTPSQIVLESCSYAAANKSFSDLVSMANNLYAAINNDDDINLICADMRKFYKYENGAYASPLMVDETLVPVYNTEVLMEIENSASAYSITRSAITEDSVGNLVQSITCTGSLLSNVFDTNNAELLTSTARATLDDKLFNFHYVMPQATDFAIASRLTNVVVTEGGNLHVKTGTELIDAYSIFYMQDGSIKKRTAINGLGMATNATMDFIAMLSTFDWHPEVILLYGDKSETSPYPITITGTKSIWDLGIAARIPNDKISRMHDVCALSLFKVG